MHHRATTTWLIGVLLAIALFATCAFGQETTAGLQGTVKDSTGGVLVKAAVEVRSPALIGVKRMETNQGGYYRFANLPPGTYSVSVTAAGFRAFRQEGIVLAVGHLPTIDITMQVGATTETVEVSAEAMLIDAAQSKVQTNISDKVLSDLPTGRSFQSVIQFAPGARSEPLQGGYQIDGASNSENAYLVEGQETASLLDGHSAVNVPMDFVQEVQIKSSGFEAEYGGALGGVVNVIQKRGSNEWHGSAFLYYRGDNWDASPNSTIRRNPQVAANTGGTRLDQPIQNYRNKKDHYRYVTPGFGLGGSLIKDRLWFFGSTAPELNPFSRTVNFLEASGVPGKRTFNRNINTYYSLARLDFMATQKIRLYGSWAYNYQRGAGTALPGADDYSGLYNSDSTTNPDNWNGGIGNVSPNVVYNTGADITINPNLVASTKFGYFYQDYQDRGMPVGIRYYYRDTNYSYGTGGTPGLPTTAALNGTLLPSAFQHATGWYNIGNNSASVYDQFKRFNFGQDLAYFKRGFGTHNFKVGYAFTHGTNDVLSGYNTADAYVAFNQEYFPNTTNGMDRCAAIVAQNTSLYGKAGGSEDGSSCQGLWGTVNLRDLATTGKVGGWNHSFYVQDAWTIGKGLTVNVGVRMDKESLPTYDTSAGFKGISFGWGDKIAPRLGAAYDVGGKGKVKLFGSFGYFYDIMKYNLSRGSFGGDYWHDCVYALDSPDFTKIIPTRDALGHYCPKGGGNLAAVGSVPDARFIENYDYRVPANNPNQAGSLGATGLIDPNLKPMKQHEIAVGADFQITPSVVFETRYSRKRLDRTIEDSGMITQDGEIYYIVNPGLSINSITPDCNGCPKNPKAIRNYDGVEMRLTKRIGNWAGSFSYTYSRLYGNYSGLTATDISDGGGARNGANADRAFDEPYMSFDAHGKAVDGPLATDRPHTFKMYGYYNLKWWKFNTRFGAFQQVLSGTPITSYLSVWGAPVYPEGRGKYIDVTRDASSGNWVTGNVSERRTPRFSQSDLSISQSFHVSKTNEQAMAEISFDCFNCLNQHSPTYVDANLLRTGMIKPAVCGAAGTNCTANEDAAAGFDYGVLMGKGYDYIGQANTNKVTLNSRYKQVYGWQGTRNMRLNLQFTF